MTSAGESTSAAESRFTGLLKTGMAGTDTMRNLLATIFLFPVLVWQPLVAQTDAVAPASPLKEFEDLMLTSGKN
jgi:hypothetical protein